MEAFDHVHVVSDLHLGGEPGYQIFGQPRALAAFMAMKPTNGLALHP